MARETDVALLMTASGSLDIFLIRLLRMKLSVIFLQSYQQHHAASEVALTVRRMLLRRIQKFTIVSNCWFCLKMHTLIS